MGRLARLMGGNGRRHQHEDQNRRHGLQRGNEKLPEKGYIAGYVGHE